MSATFPNLNEVVSWLNAFVYVTNFRPVEVKEYIKIGDKVCDSTGNVIKNLTSDLNGDYLGIKPLIKETILDKGQLLVFC